MGDMDKYFPSRFLRASQISKPVIVTILGAREEIIEGEPRLAVVFKELVKPLILNKTNYKKIAEIAGSPESKNWAGTMVEIYTMEIDFRGDTVEAIRIKEPKKKGEK